MSRRRAAGSTSGSLAQRRRSSSRGAAERGRATSWATGLPARVIVNRSPRSARSTTSPPWFLRSRIETLDMRDDCITCDTEARCVSGVPPEGRLGAQNRTETVDSCARNDRGTLRMPPNAGSEQRSESERPSRRSRWRGGAARTTRDHNQQHGRAREGVLRCRHPLAGAMLASATRRPMSPGEIPAQRRGCPCCSALARRLTERWCGTILRMPASPYYRSDLARIHHEGFGFHADAVAPGILRLLGPVLDRGGLVLELGCGSGLLTKYLVAAGHRVLATDASPAMVELARTYVPGVRVEVLRLPDDPLPPADAIVSVGHPLSYLDSEEDIDRALAAVAGALDANGVLAFDICDLIS